MDTDRLLEFFNAWKEQEPEAFADAIRNYPALQKIETWGVWGSGSLPESLEDPLIAALLRAIRRHKWPFSISQGQIACSVAIYCPDCKIAAAPTLAEALSTCYLTALEANHAATQ